MAISISELIDKRDAIKKTRGALYELETSIGDIVVKTPSSKLMADVWNISDNMESNKFLILECVVEPNLKDEELKKAYGVVEPVDIVPSLFQVGEIARIASAILKLAGFEGQIKTKIHNDIKN